MANETQILASAVVDLLHYSHIPSFQYSVAGVSTIPFTGRRGLAAEDVIMQNKANFRMAQQKLTAGREKGYVKKYELCVCGNKANLVGRACSVPVRASVETQRFASPRTGPGAKQSQFPPALAGAGWLRHARQPHGPKGCGRNTAAIPAASVGRAWVPKRDSSRLVGLPEAIRRFWGPGSPSPLACLADSRPSELSWENAQQEWRARTLAPLCGPNPRPNADRTQENPERAALLPTRPASGKLMRQKMNVLCNR